MAVSTGWKMASVFWKSFLRYLGIVVVVVVVVNNNNIKMKKRLIR